jgi:CRISPR-associated protein Cas5t
MAGLVALKVVTSAATTSFRYPRVQVGRLPTFEMPPPATIYGQIAAVLGEWFEPRGLEFSYVFEHAGKALDLETIHPIEKGSGKATLAKRGWPHPVNVQCSTNIQGREFLLRPRMTLYLRSGDAAFLEELRKAFLSPFYAYVLGRSQDLATCHGAELVELEWAEDAFFANTLLPMDWRPYVIPGTTVLLPAAIDYERRRLAVQERYLQVTKPALRVFDATDDILDRGKLPPRFAVTSEEMRTGDRTLRRGLHFLPVRGPRVDG